MTWIFYGDYLVLWTEWYLKYHCRKMCSSTCSCASISCTGPASTDGAIMQSIGKCNTQFTISYNVITQKKGSYYMDFTSIEYWKPKPSMVECDMLICICTENLPNWIMINTPNNQICTRNIWYHFVPHYHAMYKNQILSNDIYICSEILSWFIGRLFVHKAICSLTWT